MAEPRPSILTRLERLEGEAEHRLKDVRLDQQETIARFERMETRIGEIEAALGVNEPPSLVRANMADEVKTWR